MDKKSEIFEAMDRLKLNLPHMEESNEPKVDKKVINEFFSIEEEEADLLEEYATEEEKASWSLEDFIVKTINNHADDAIANAKQLVKPKTDIFKNAKDRVAKEKIVQESIEKIEQERVEQTKPEAIAKTMAEVERKPIKEDVQFDPQAGDRNFQRSLTVMKRELQRHIADIYKKESVQMLRKIESMGGGGGGGSSNQEQVDLNTADIAQLSASATFSPLISSNHTAIEKLILSGVSGYDVTGAFAGKDPSAGFVWTETGGILYTPEQAAEQKVMTFSLDPGIQGNTDAPYWSTPAPEEHVGRGLFGGAYLPNQPLAKTPIFAFSAVNTDTFNDGTNIVTNGRISLSGASYGDQLRVRFDLNVIPQVTNTTITPMLWYNNATPAGVVTYSFELPTQPVFYGQGTTGTQHLMRVEISAWIANEEDVHALVYPAVKADNPCIFKPSSMMATIIR